MVKRRVNAHKKGRPKKHWKPLTLNIKNRPVYHADMSNEYDLSESSSSYDEQESEEEEEKSD